MLFSHADAEDMPHVRSVCAFAELSSVELPGVGQRVCEAR